MKPSPLKPKSPKVLLFVAVNERELINLPLIASGGVVILFEFIYETFTKKNWDAWGTHTLDSSYESYISALKLYRLCKHQGFKKEKLRGADYYNAWLSWIPWLYQNYKFMDKHPCFLLGKLPIIKFFGMDFFMLLRK